MTAGTNVPIVRFKVRLYAEGTEEPQVLKLATICPDSDLRGQLADGLATLPGVYVLRRFDHYPNYQELTRFMRAAAPDAVFLSLESLDQALDVVRSVEEASPRSQIVAVHRNCDVETILRIMQAGVRHFLTVPLATEALAGTLARVAELRERVPPEPRGASSVFSFLPAKPGAGTSTIALNTALCLATAEQPSVLLVDFDLNLGAIGPMLKLSYRNTVVQAAEVAATLDQRTWLELVSAAGRLHVLPSRLNPSAWLEPIQVGHLLDFAQMNYSYVLADHSGNLERCSLTVLNESRRIFLVVDGDPLSLHHAKQKLEFLQAQDLHKRVTVLLNRVHRDDQNTTANVSAFLGVQPTVVFPHDRERILHAVRTGTPVDSRSGFAKACSELAALVINRESAPERPAHRFLQFFSLAGAESR